MPPSSVFAAFFDLEKHQILSCELVEAGLINATYKVEIVDTERKISPYILQKINSTIFKDPEAIMTSMDRIARHLVRQNYPDAVLLPIRNRNSDWLSYDEEHKPWRLLPYIPQSVCLEKIVSPLQAFESAKTFSRFYAHLWDIDLSGIKPAIPGFLDFSSRILSFKQALFAADETRKQIAGQEIAYVTAHLPLPEKFIALQKEEKLPLRLVHGDPKFSNILFDQTGSRGLCVIDLDTLMPGTLLYDFGDMVRSYTNNRAEDDASENAVFNREICEAVRAGFLFYLRDKLLPIEKDNMAYAAQVVVFIQAVRFLTDYLNGNIYYKITYPLQNLQRTRNQINLLKALEELERK